MEFFPSPRGDVQLLAQQREAKPEVPSTDSCADLFNLVRVKL